MTDLELISSIALTFMNKDDFDTQMNSVLKSLGNHLQVSRVYLFVDDESGKTTSNIYEWCGEGIKKQIDELQNLPYDLFPSWKKILISEGKICSENITELPKDIVEILLPQEIVSILVYPLYIEHEMKGFIGFDECKQNRKWNAELEILLTITGIVSSAYERKLWHERVIQSEQNFKEFFNTIDDLFLIGNSDGKILYSNRAVTDKLGYSKESLQKMNILDLHPKDKQEEASEIIKAMFKGERESCPLELEDNSGNFLPVETRVWFGKWDGQDCIFGISKDLSKENEALQKFTKLFDNNPALMAISDIEDKTFTDINLAFLKKLGYSRDELIGKNSRDVGIFIDIDSHAQIANQLLQTGKINDVELQVKCKDGKVLNGLFYGEIIENQRSKYFLTVMVDITEQITLRKRVEEQKQKLEYIIHGTQLGTWEWNVQTGETIFNKRWAEIIGYSLEELFPVTIETWVHYAHPEDLEKSNALLQKHFSGETEYYNFECRMKHKNGKWIWVLDRGKVIEWDEEGKPLKMFGTHTDITEKKNMEEELKEISIRDPLINIYNRRYIFERLNGILSEYLRYNKAFSISIIDLDNFKHINDQYGHQAGDFILIEFAKLINSFIRSYDLLGRYGGEEFIIITINIDKKTTASRLEQILDFVRTKTFYYKNSEINFTFSCGIADSFEINVNDISIDKLIEIADNRLYEAKNTGRNQVLIESTSEDRNLVYLK